MFWGFTSVFSIGWWCLLVILHLPARQVSPFAHACACPAFCEHTSLDSVARECFQEAHFISEELAPGAGLSSGGLCLSPVPAFLLTLLTSDGWAGEGAQHLAGTGSSCVQAGT